MSKETRFNKFIKLCSKLEAIEFIGVAHILNVTLFKEDGRERDFESIFSDMMDNFLLLNTQRQKTLLKLIKLDRLNLRWRKDS